MDDKLEKFISNYVRKWHWGVPKWIDADDLIQDAYELFYKCVERYKDHPRVPDRARLIGLFKSALFNYMVSLGKKNVRAPEAFAADLAEDENVVFDGVLGVEDGVSEFMAATPPKLRRILKVLDDHPEELRKPYRRRKGGKRETTEEWNRRVNASLCKEAGLDPSNVLSELRDYLSN
jgi:DNA-directed RNA polymerase specialized sigma24 family protein